MCVRFPSYSCDLSSCVLIWIDFQVYVYRQCRFNLHDFIPNLVPDVLWLMVNHIIQHNFNLPEHVLKTII